MRGRAQCSAEMAVESERSSSSVTIVTQDTIILQ